MGRIGSRPRIVAPESQRLTLGELRGDCRLEPLSLAADGPEMGILGELGWASLLVGISSNRFVKSD